MEYIQLSIIILAVLAVCILVYYMCEWYDSWNNKQQSIRTVTRTNRTLSRGVSKNHGELEKRIRKTASLYRHRADT